MPFAQDVVHSYERLQAEVDGLTGLKSGIIRIATFSSAATHIVPKIIEKFQKDFPGIDYEVLMGEYSEIEQWVSEGRVDCGLSFSKWYFAKGSLCNMGGLCYYVNGRKRSGHQYHAEADIKAHALQNQSDSSVSATFERDWDYSEK